MAFSPQAQAVLESPATTMTKVANMKSWKIELEILIFICKQQIE